MCQNRMILAWVTWFYISPTPFSWSPAWYRGGRIQWVITTTKLWVQHCYEVVSWPMGIELSEKHWQHLSLKVVPISGLAHGLSWFRIPNIGEQIREQLWSCDVDLSLLDVTSYTPHGKHYTHLNCLWYYITDLQTRTLQTDRQTSKRTYRQTYGRNAMCIATF